MKKNLPSLLFLCIIFSVFPVFSRQEDSEEQDSDSVVSMQRITTYIDSTTVEQRFTYTKEDIDKMHAESLPALFQAAGIQMLSYGSYGLESKPSIRGFTDETVRVVIDGICTNNAQYGTFDFSTININDIEKIEIVKGGFSEQVSDEGAVAGVIYITTKKQNLGHKFYSDSMIKSFFNHNKPADTISQSIGYSGHIFENTYLKTNIKGTAAHNEFPFKNYMNGISIRQNAAVHDAHGNIKLSHFFGNGNNWNFSNSSYYGLKNIPGKETSTTYGFQKDFDNNLSFSLIFPSLKESIKIENNAAWLSNTRFYEEKNSESRHYVNSFIISSAANFYKYSRLKQSAGITLNLTNLNSTDDGIHSVLSGAFKETTKIRMSDIFSICIPLSAKFSGKNFAFIPKLGIRADFKYFDFIMNGYRMIQFPNMDDLYWGNTSTAAGNPNLSSECGWGAEFTINGHDILIPFSLCVFSNYYENKIQWSSDSSGKWTPKNIASAFYIGIDFSFEKTFFNIFSLKGNLEYLYNRLLDKSNKLTYGKRIMWTPDFVGSLIFSINTKYIYFSAEANYVGKKYISNLNISFTEPYWLINSSAEIKISEYLKPYFRIENILDSDYEAVPEYPMPGISFSIGMKASL